VTDREDRASRAALHAVAGDRLVLCVLFHRRGPGASALPGQGGNGRGQRLCGPLSAHRLHRRRLR